MAKRARNPNGVVVMKCCASCQYKLIRKDGQRFCEKNHSKVAQKHCCGLWKMSYMLNELKTN